jgi:DinB family protein
MTAQELLKIQIDDAQFQLSKVLDGIPEAELDAKPLPTMMSAREMAEHLVEVYIAAGEQAAGQSHEWGSFKAADTSWGPLTAELWKEREAAAAAILASSDPAVLGAGAAFLASHDSYHVGQLCALRLALNPDWNPYSIYPMDA